MAYVEQIQVGAGEAWDLRDAAAHEAIDALNDTLAGVNNSITSMNNSITSLNNLVSQIKLSVYPVGSIYMSVESTSPADRFGGTWERLQDRFLLGAGSTYSAGSTGGEASHTLTVNEIPSHNHVGLYEADNNDLMQWYRSSSSRHRAIDGATASDTDDTPDIYTGSTGGGQAHNNMPPYLVVYMWKRTA